MYTRTGDKGKSSLYTGERRRKDDAVFSALGDTDELNAAIGLAREHCASAGLASVDTQLQQIQSRLLDAGSAIATPASSASEQALARAAFADKHATELEAWIDAMDDELPTLRNFILPVRRCARLFVGGWLRMAPCGVVAPRRCLMRVLCSVCVLSRCRAHEGAGWGSP